MLKLEKNPNYAAKIVRVDSIQPIPNADKLVKVFIDHDSAIIDSSIKVGDICVFFPVGSDINPQYLTSNNLYKDPALNQDKNKNGFFGANGRVQMMKLRGEYSMGFLAPVETLEKTWPELKTMIWSRYINIQFDYIDDIPICWKYVVPKKTQPHKIDKVKYKKRFNRLIPGQFHFHYDTELLKNHIDEFSPFDDIDITVKVHGTSVILSNIRVKRKLNLWERIKRMIGYYVPTEEFGYVYSSRKVIKNKYLKKTDDYYDIYGCVARDFSKYLAKGMTVYGEIVGYLEGENKYIQKNHDYGCQPGQWKFMPYRITQTSLLGFIKEWEVQEVIDWTNNLRSMCEHTHSGLAEKIMPMILLYHGKAGDMYNNLYQKVAISLTEEQYKQEVEDYKQSETYDGQLPEYLESDTKWVINKWRTAWLETMKKDGKLLLMEKREPLCKNKVPREGVVIRKCQDPKSEAFKLKSAAHWKIELMEQDNGEINIEQ